MSGTVGAFGITSRSETQQAQGNLTSKTWQERRLTVVIPDPYPKVLMATIPIELMEEIGLSGVASWSKQRHIIQPVEVQGENEVRGVALPVNVEIFDGQIFEAREEIKTDGVAPPDQTVLPKGQVEEQMISAHKGQVAGIGG
ncbi:hypothetical protein Sjap_017637 [Stephania japonica]|uniref:Uncharacterized protein n=1 Tax=Stephania japonica TaxID=461633 RepID=A0AAP0I6I7_9MAGN